MLNRWTQSTNQTDSPLLPLAAIIIFSYPLFYLVIRSWVNASLFLLGIISIFFIANNIATYTKNKTTAYWLIVGAFAAPLATEILAQIFRNQWHPSSMDGPSRFLISGLVFMFLSQQKPIPVHKYLPLSLIASLAICFAAFWWNTQAFNEWGGRTATYFSDPNTLGAYVSAIIIIVVIHWHKTTSLIVKLTTPFVISAGLYLVVLSQTRSGWTSLIISIFIYVFLTLKEKNSFSAYVGAIITTAIIITAYYKIDLINSRTNTAIQEVITYYQGQRDSSVGIRISLMRIDWFLFTEYPLSGVQDGYLPPLESLAKTESYVTPVSYDMKLSAGSHNEFLAQISRKGLWGILSIIGLFIIPMYQFARQLYSTNQTAKQLAQMGFYFCLAIAISSLTIQVFNLKYTSSFYSLTIAILLAELFKYQQLNNQK